MGDAVDIRFPSNNIIIMTRLTELKQGQLCLNILILMMQIEAGMDQFYCHCNKTDKLKKANQGWFRQYDLISNNRDFFTAFSEKTAFHWLSILIKKFISISTVYDYFISFIPFHSSSCSMTNRSTLLTHGTPAQQRTFT